MPAVLASRPAAPMSRRCARAPRSDGDDWVINGQKIWTSGAHYSDFGILRDAHRSERAEARGPDVVLPVDMKSPGVEMRPIKQMSGGANFNEVFFTDVRIPDSQRLGAVGARLEGRADDADERAHGVRRRAPVRTVEDLLELAASYRARGRAGDQEQSGAREARRLVSCTYQGLKFTQFRTHDGAVARRDAGPGGLDRQAGQRADELQDLAVLRAGPLRHGRRHHGRTTTCR